MQIKVVMKSKLNCHLKPDFVLLNQAREELNKSGKIKDNLKYVKFLLATDEANSYIQTESEIAKELRTVSTEEEKNILKEKKQEYTKLADAALEKSLNLLCEAGGFDAYHYNYDLHFNRVVAGLMGSTCYMKDTFEQLKNKGVKNILAIANVVEESGHHSTFGHSHLTLEITGIPKALAMVLNNEKEYCTSEKSARYTVMTEIEPTQLAMYDKWKEIFIKEINKKYGKCQPFFDKNGTKALKLAQENARYMISVFTPSNMVYTTSFRQLNYLAHWFENEIQNPNSNSFYSGIKPEMKEFVKFIKDQGLYSEKLEDHKDRKLSLFGNGILKNILSSDVYSIKYDASLACLAQEHRHRTLNYHINEIKFEKGEQKFFIPPILQDNPALAQKWLADMLTVKDFIPQGRLVEIIENGQTSDFLLKAMERECSMAQWEIMDLTKKQSKDFSKELNMEILEAEQELECIMQDSDKENLENIIEGTKVMQKKFDGLSHGARCTVGYKCQSPCAFKEGITLERKI